MPSLRLPASALERRCDPGALGFTSTADLVEAPAAQSPNAAKTQSRAVAAIRFGVGMSRHGYNLFVLGSAGLGRRTLVEGVLRAAAVPSERPRDWCYVNNFTDPQRPIALSLPNGRARAFRDDMQGWINELRVAIPAAFDNEEYRARLNRIEAEYNDLQEQAFTALASRAAADGIALLRTPAGFSFGPLDGHEVMSPEKFHGLPPERQRELAAHVQRYEGELEKVVREASRLRRDRLDHIRALNQEVIEAAVGQITEELLRRYAELSAVSGYINAAKADVIGRADDFRRQHDSPPEAPAFAPRPEPDFRRYQVNVMVGDGTADAVSIVYEDNPTYANLVGRVEHLSQFGTLSTDFNLIRPGSLHRANGGYLMIDAIKLLTQPYAWEGLKRALRSRDIRIESLGQIYSLVATQSLEPEPIPLDLKVILFGPRLIYLLLGAADPEFATLFRVAAELEEDVPWDEDAGRAVALIAADMVRQRGLRPFGADAVAAVVERCARLAGDATRLSVHLQTIEELLTEADYWAGDAGRSAVGAADVGRAVTEKIERSASVKERLTEAILRDILMIDTTGSVVGQINGLAVYQIGPASFGQPQRITATTRLGKGEVVDIQRETAQAGPAYSKGVLTLSAYLATHYARHRGLSINATLTFEQTYGPVDGDSASLAEICALVSSIAGAPIRQSLAVTGSINQHGTVQAIGGVNEKIEGFFDICRSRGLTGAEGVIIPHANRAHLMLRRDVIDAVAAGQFSVYTVTSVDDALELLTGQPAGKVDANGRFAQGSVNASVAARLESYASTAHGGPAIRRKPEHRRRSKAAE